jgi:signal transduction histidine kinase
MQLEVSLAAERLHHHGTRLDLFRRCLSQSSGIARHFTLCACAILFLIATLDGALAEPKRVLVLHSFGRDFSPWAEFARSFRTELDRKSPGSVEFFDAALTTERFGADQDEGPFTEYLQALFANRQLDLIVAIGAPAARYVQQRRQQLFPSTPMLFTGVEQRIVPFATLSANDAVVAISVDHAPVIRTILDLLPDTTDIAVVVGVSPIEKRWLEQLRNALQRYKDRVAVTSFNDLPFDETLKRVAALPPKSVIYFYSQVVDSAGHSYEGQKALASLRAVSNAPIFNHLDVNFGHGLVGGPLISISDLAQKAADVSVRILGGEAPGSIVTPPVGQGKPKFDWRELQRWNISEALLPPGSEVHFRAPGMWEQYRWQLSLLALAILLQAALISGLLLERHRRSLAEVEARSSRREAIHLNRVATATVLSSSIAHELNQPLGAILINAETAQQMLRAVPPDLNQIDEILSDIARDDQRANEILHRQGSLLKKEKDRNLQVFDLNSSVEEVVDIAGPEARKRGIALSVGLASGALPVRADRIQMQQVILNLVMNGMDALENCDQSTRRVSIQTARSAKSPVAELTVSDSGKGVPDDKLNSIFDAFFTTKAHGTGLGLPIARTIIETYGGAIWAENRIGGGAAFQFTMPLIEAHSGSSSPVV